MACPNCSKMYKNAESLRCHLGKDCGKRNRFSCDVCEYYCSRRFELGNHMSRKHSIVLPRKLKIVCLQCNRKYKNQNSLRVHMSLDCGKEKRITCPICRKFKTSRKFQLGVHMFRKIRCPQCEKVYKNFETLRAHMSYDCGRKKRKFRCAVCGNCGKVYKNKKSRNNHVRYECGVAPSFFCPFVDCPYKAKRKFCLQQHLLFRHKIKKPSSYTCPKCGKMYRHSQSRFTHLKFECGKDPQFYCTEYNLSGFPCDNCYRSYKHLRSLQNHRKFECGKKPRYGCTVKGWNYPCPNCSIPCMDKSTQMRHVRFECELGRSFPCPYRNCTYKAKLKHHLAYHMSSSKHRIYNTNVN
ncbi:PREDICTED: zinc finger protein 425-like [Nicrophorus vespilloides]|uniref:Zinc finger protein 425-like n=1 Tax=Nicrophorus vespilloides TaxID=110193 RepID=A0ABM1N9H9_NICVS|nr:PREDICTED: zinc finger protein 425-like [Nicrophorus vespilloides]